MTAALLNYPTWTADLEPGDVVVLYSPSGERYLADLESGRLGRGWFEAVNGSGGYMDYEYDPGSWTFEVKEEYRGLQNPERRIASFSGPRGEAVLQFRVPLPVGADTEIAAQLSGEADIPEDFEYGIQQQRRSEVDPLPQSPAEGSEERRSEVEHRGSEGQERRAFYSKVRRPVGRREAA